METGMNLGGRKTALVLLALAGLVVSVLAGLSGQVTALSTLCTAVSDGCGRTASIRLLFLPVWVWGALFYSALAVSLLWRTRVVAWLAAAGIGAEAAFVWAMFSMNVFCVYCVANLVVILLLFALAFRREMVWQMLAVGQFCLLLTVAGLIHGNDLKAGVPGPAVQESPSSSNWVAWVGGETISMDEVVNPLAAKIHELDMEIYRLKRERLDTLINDRLLNMEARQRGIPMLDMLRQVIPRDRLKVDEAEVDAALAQKTQSDPQGKAKDRERVREELRQEKANQLIAEFANSLRDKYGVAVRLDEPKMPAVLVDTRSGQALGPVDAPVTVVEFSDYECPVCRRGHQTVREVRELYKDKVRWVFKDFPLESHTWAAKAAEAARCAADQGRFWEYQDAVYAAEGLDPAHLSGLAKDLGLDLGMFDKCLSSGKHREDVLRDRESGRRIGIEGTPSFVVGGRLQVGMPSREKLVGLIEDALKASGAPASGQ